MGILAADNCARVKPREANPIECLTHGDMGDTEKKWADLLEWNDNKGQTHPFSKAHASSQ